ncbi:MAG: hypothetical protein SWK76_12465 [Actinomycetota bacterium]|nr:hypothetical protein [Actinomycetota bacterium]
MITELMDALKAAERDDGCRVVILDRKGEVFSAGHGISEEIPVGCTTRTQET